MIVTTFAGGSQTAVIATEHFVATPTAPGHYQFKVDRASMAANDVLELRVYGMVAAGGTSRAVYMMPYYGVAPTDDKISYAPVLVNDHSGSNAVRFSIKQTFGTGRVYDWAVMAWDTATAATSVADSFLDRDMALGVDSGSSTVRTVRQALRSGRNKVDIAGVVYKEDDTTVSWTFTVASDSSTDRIISMDPAGP